MKIDKAILSKNYNLVELYVRTVYVINCGSDVNECIKNIFGFFVRGSMNLIWLIYSSEKIVL